eukprot:CAMPEP_0175765330 /NCGR_PEP_ID=MMETSP0097-20121207/68744_1 /TAXON_ID=311494 /ORGANISM="Alexandrium monilatum, Strain CCMP3105" /LENGTH=214 /DNA_ID=CAMNT_0017075181 /DNA_START=28 /DNA_END=668 /DNA_ORIENTATION=+
MPMVDVVDEHFRHLLGDGVQPEDARGLQRRKVEDAVQLCTANPLQAANVDPVRMDAAHAASGGVQLEDAWRHGWSKVDASAKLHSIAPLKEVAGEYLVSRDATHDAACNLELQNAARTARSEVDAAVHCNTPAPLGAAAEDGPRGDATQIASHNIQLQYAGGVQRREEDPIANSHCSIPTALAHGVCAMYVARGAAHEPRRRVELQYAGRTPRR